MLALEKLAEAANLKGKISDMVHGKHINITEDRAVGHIALRMPKGSSMVIDGINVVEDVNKVLDSIYLMSENVRSGKHIGVTGKHLTDVVSIGIGGSYLGVEFVYEALRKETSAEAASAGRKLRFLANVDPVDVSRALEGLNPESTLVIVVSKTFTTAETMMNAKTVRDWLLKSLTAKSTAEHVITNEAIVAHHMMAVSTNIPATTAFGIDPKNVFGFWDWVGGRYSVTSAVGLVPLSLHFGRDVMAHFLRGAHVMDSHFTSAPLLHNLPVLLGLIGVWNSSFLGHASRALLPYAQALLRFPAHIQQVDMESNGKRVTVDGVELPFQAGEVNFGEPGTNGQHSFYQLIHQGRVVPCDFLGFMESQRPIELQGESVSNHDELMSNFFAQPDALAIGKSAEELRKENVPEHLVPHKVFSGNRPSSSILFARLDAYTCGQLLALYEHRTAVEGFVWNVPSFDQWGVELGKVLAKNVRSSLANARKSGAEPTGFNPSTSFLMKKYVSHVDPRY
jgi:glucose-6-phosphate isomerase